MLFKGEGTVAYKKSEAMWLRFCDMDEEGRDRRITCFHESDECPTWLLFEGFEDLGYELRGFDFLIDRVKDFAFR